MSIVIVHEQSAVTSSLQEVAQQLCVNWSREVILGVYKNVCIYLIVLIIHKWVKCFLNNNYKESH